MDILLSTSEIDLDNEFNDIKIIDGKLSLTSNTVLEVSQRLRVRLKTYRQEWYGNTSVGVPYLDNILVKNINKEAVDGLFKALIIETEGVLSLDFFSSEYSERYRTYSATFKCRVINNEGGSESLLLTI